MEEGGAVMNGLQAAAAVTLWRSGRFDTLDIARALGGRACGVTEADVDRLLAAVRERERGPDLRLVRGATE